MTPARKPLPTDIIDNGVLRAIFGVARECSVSNDELHEAIMAGCRKKSLKDLTRREAFRLMDGLRKTAGQTSPNRRRAQAAHGRKDVDPDVIYQPTGREWAMLRKAAALRNWSEEALGEFILRQLRREIRTLADYNKILWALKAMNRREGLHA